MKIEAEGIKNGHPLMVEVFEKGGDIICLFNGRDDIDLYLELLDILASGVSIGGTYYPKSIGLQYCAALGGGFFDKSPIINAVDIEEITPQPYGEDVTY